MKMFFSMPKRVLTLWVVCWVTGGLAMSFGEADLKVFGERLFFMAFGFSFFVFLSLSVHSNDMRRSDTAENANS